MDEKHFEELLKKYDERLDNMSDEEFQDYCTKLGLIQNNNENNNSKTK